jgi:hypothetical protein
MSELEDFWAEDRWTRAYGYRPTGGDNPYTLGYHIAQDIAGLTWHGPVPALRSGRVVATGRSSSIGGYVIIQANADGLYDSYTHLYTGGSMPRVGQPVAAGDSLPRLARSTSVLAGHDYMGSASSGPHLHFGVATTSTNCYAPVRGRDRDPRPIIRKALAAKSPAGGGATPIDPEEDMPTPEEIAKAVWEYKSNVNNRLFGDMTRQTWESVRYGKAGDRTHGDLTAALLTNLGAVKGNLATLATTVGKLDAASISDAQVEDIADELAATLPPAIVTALGKQLLKK